MVLGFERERKGQVGKSEGKRSLRTDTIEESEANRRPRKQLNSCICIFVVEKVSCGRGDH